MITIKKVEIDIKTNLIINRFAMDVIPSMDKVKLYVEYIMNIFDIVYSIKDMQIQGTSNHVSVEIITNDIISPHNLVVEDMDIGPARLRPAFPTTLGAWTTLVS